MLMLLSIAGKMVYKYEPIFYCICTVLRHLSPYSEKPGLYICTVVIYAICTYIHLYIYAFMCDLILETDQIVTIGILRNTDFKY